MSDGNATVAILLCIFQGETFLKEQLDSFAWQTHRDWQLFVSIDGSNVETNNILRKFQDENLQNKIHLRNGPQQGCLANFLSLVCDTTIETDYYAFSDQDDIWEANKLTEAIKWLNTIPADVPAIFCSRTSLIDHEGKNIGYSPFFKKTPSFAHAIMQNIATGNTMVFNHAAKKLLILAGKDVCVFAHDWWLYIVVSACGGKIKFDRDTFVRYRQHGTNLVGFNRGLRHKIKSFYKLMQGQYKSYNEEHVIALNKLIPYMTPENREVFNKFVEMRKAKLFNRLIGFYRSGIYRQTMVENIGLAVAALMNRL
jgi:glycosyltransferase involved in cell wall biosynthesis